MKSTGSAFGGRLYPSRYLGMISISRPDVTQKVGKVDIAIFQKEVPVAPAAIHQIGIKLTTKLRLGLRDDPRQVVDPFQLLAE